MDKPKDDGNVKDGNGGNKFKFGIRQATSTTATSDPFFKDFLQKRRADDEATIEQQPQQKQKQPRIDINATVRSASTTTASIPTTSSPAPPPPPSLPPTPTTTTTATVAAVVAHVPSGHNDRDTVSTASSSSTSISTSKRSSSISETFAFLKNSRHYVASKPKPAPSVGDNSSSTTSTSSTFLKQPDSINPAASSHSIIVNPRQKGNPLLKHIRNVAWEFSDIAPDFLMGLSTCALFLSLRYHKLHPDYIHGRLREIARAYKLRVLLVLLDVKDTDDVLRELSRLAVLKGLTMIVALDNREAGRYLETYKMYENKPPDMLQGIKSESYLDQLRECLTCVRSVNKTDTVTLLSTFGSLQDIIQAQQDDLRMCPGFGEQKADRLHQLFRTPFRKKTD